MFGTQPEKRRIGVRSVLHEAATLVNGSGPLETILAAVCDRLATAAGASEIRIAVGIPRSRSVRWKRTRAGFGACNEPVDDPIARAVLEDGEARLDEARAYAPLIDDGRIIGVLWMISRTDLYDDDALALCDAFAGYVSLALQKAALRERARTLEELVVVDALTCVANRRAFDAALEREWTRATRAHRSIAVALLDVDHFKLFNDVYGHQEGDTCLTRIAQACKGSVVRAADCFARYGGEEFGIVIADAELPVATLVAERLRAAVEALQIPHAASPRGFVTVSVGIASIVPRRGMRAHDLVERADRALYRAKGTGRDRVVAVDAGEADMPSAAPALAAIPNNLPVATGPLIGRDDDIARITDLLETYRVVTLTGAGGVGKTSLALDVARRRLGRDRDGIWFAELAPLGDEAHVVSAFATLFGVEEHADRSSTASLVAALQERRVLLLVDNCEHVVATVSRTLAAIVRDAPGVRVLTTSREPLGIAGEATYRVPPLATPPSETTPSAAVALRYSAVRLFVDRATAADDAFALTDANAPVVAEICRRLDGIALAIELAAARVRMLDPARIAELLHSRFQLLSSGNRSALPHQQTLRATIDWSYDLLGPAERTLFERVAIFAGGFTLDAILAVCATDHLEPEMAFGALSALVDKSLVVFEAPRYRFLESTREYANERLDAAGERAALQAHHAAYYRSLVERTSLHEGQGSYRAWVTPLVDELDNLRAALDWTLGAGHDAPAGAGICAALVETSSLGRWSEWAGWNARALDAVPAADEPHLHGRLLTRRAELAARYGAFDNTVEREAAREACALLRDAPEAKWRLEALNAYATALIDSANVDEAATVAREGLELARDTHDFVYQASFLRRLASLLAATDPDEAALMYEESISLCRLLENDFGIALSYHGMSHVHFGRGRLDDAIAAARIAADVRRDMGDRRGLAYALADVAQFSLARGNTEGVAAALREALDVVRHTENTLALALVAQATATFSLARGGITEATQLAAFADTAFATLGVEREAVADTLRRSLQANLERTVPGEQRSGLIARGTRLASADAQKIAAFVLDGA
jgi:diguanylate cyclase (GGDEF)-like protein